MSEEVAGHGNCGRGAVMAMELVKRAVVSKKGSLKKQHDDAKGNTT